MADDINLSEFVGAFSRAGENKEALRNVEDRVFSLPVSSETPYTRTHPALGQYVEILGHSAEEVNLARMNGAPLLVNHEAAGVIAGVVLRAYLKDSRMYADVRFSRKNAVAEILQDVRDGVIRNVSIGYKVNAVKLVKAATANQPPVYRATQWMPAEVSLVGVPADHTVGFGRADAAQPVDDLDLVIEEPDPGPVAGDVVEENRSHHGSGINEDIVMDDEKTTPAVEAAPVEPVAVDMNAARADWMAAEQQRQADVTAVFAPFAGQHGELANQCRSDMSVDAGEASRRLLAALSAKAAPVAGAVQVDARDKFREGAELALSVRAGLGEADLSGNEFRGLSLLDIAKMSLRHVGQDISGDPMDLIGRAITTSSSDFPNLLANLANKGLMKGFQYSPETYSKWTRAGSVSDFKSVSRVGLGGISTLDEVYENGKYDHGSLSEYAESGALRTFGKIMNFSRQMIINDDLNGLNRVPFMMGLRASEKVGDLAYATLTANANLSDGVALFATARGNLETSGGVPNTARIEAARAALGNYQSRTDDYVTVIPKYLLCAHGLLGSARAALESDAWVGTAGSAEASDQKNIVKGLVEPIADRRLDAYSSGNPWFMVPDPNVYDFVELLYLNGRQTPVLERQNAFEQDGVMLKIRFDVAALVLDANAFQNDGVT